MSKTIPFAHHDRKTDIVALSWTHRGCHAATHDG